MQFLSGDNCAQALYLAFQGLTPEKTSVAAGQAYFISDGTPIDSYEFFRPLHELYQKPFPKLKLPFLSIYYFAWFLESIYFVLQPCEKFLGFVPLITRAEVNQMAVSHYFSIEKAKSQLNYHPKNSNDLTGVVEYYRKMLKNDKMTVKTDDGSIGFLTFMKCTMLLVSAFLVYYFFSV